MTPTWPRAATARSNRPLDTQRDSDRHMDISWPTNPDVWEEARAQLTAIIERGVKQGRLSP